MARPAKRDAIVAKQTEMRILGKLANVMCGQPPAAHLAKRAGIVVANKN